MKTVTFSKVGTAKVVVDIIPQSNNGVRPAYKLTPKYITVHNTGNASKGAGADLHRRYINNQAVSKKPRVASWHFSVDDELVIQHVPLDENAWHCGDGNGAASGNRTSIGIEICMNPDMDYAKAEANAIALIIELLKMYKLPTSAVRTHQSWSGKYCPQVILSSKEGWAGFMKRVETAYKGGTATKVSVKPTTPKTPVKPVTASPVVPAVLQEGNEGYGVKLVQTYLNKYGYRLATDGIFGAGTERAVIDFQRKYGLSADGLVGAKTLEALKTKAVAFSIVREGDKGEAVRYVQVLLSNRGYNLIIDGIAGNGTDAAIRAFQKKAGLTADGIVGKATLAKLI